MSAAAMRMCGVNKHTLNPEGEACQGVELVSPLIIVDKLYKVNNIVAQ